MAAALRNCVSPTTAEPQALNKEQQAGSNSKAADICLFLK